MPRVAVLGGGISGLAAAFKLTELDPQLEVAVYERDAAVGGCIRTVTVDGSTLELGADSLLIEKAAIASLLDRLGLSERIVDVNPEYRGALLLHRGTLRPLPRDFRLFAPRSLGALLRSRIFSPLGLVRAAAEPLVPPRRASDDETLAQFVTRRFGSEVLERLAQPLIAGIYSADPRNLSAQMSVPQFVRYEREYGSVLRGLTRERSSSSPRLVSLEGGLRTLVDALAERLSDRIRAHSRVDAVVRDKLAWNVHSRGTVQRYDALVCALPCDAAAALFANVDETIRDALASIQLARVAAVTLLYDAAAVALPRATGFVVPFVERRRITAATFVAQKYPRRCPASVAAMRVFIGGALHEHLLDASDDALVNLASAELSALRLTRAQPRGAIVRRWTNLPQYGLNHRLRVAALRERTALIGSLAFAGCALEGVGIPDCVASGESAATSVFGYLGAAKGARTTR